MNKCVIPACHPSLTLEYTYSLIFINELLVFVKTDLRSGRNIFSYNTDI